MSDPGFHFSDERRSREEAPTAFVPIPLDLNLKFFVILSTDSGWLSTHSLKEEKLFISSTNFLSILFCFPFLLT